MFKKDIIGLVDEEFDAKALLLPVMKKGKLLHKIPTVQRIQKVAEKNISQLPDKFKDLYCKATYPVMISKRLRQVRDETMKNIDARNL